MEAQTGMPEVDNVAHPPHYTFSKYEVIDVLQAWFPADPFAWQVVKYMSRYRHKGRPLEDLQKARFYLNRLIEEVEAQEKEK